MLRVIVLSETYAELAAPVTWMPVTLPEISELTRLTRTGATTPDPTTTPMPLLSAIVQSRTSTFAVFAAVVGAAESPVVLPLNVESWTVPAVLSRRSTPTPLRANSVWSMLIVSVPAVALSSAPVPLSCNDELRDVETAVGTDIRAQARRREVGHGDIVDVERIARLVRDAGRAAEAVDREPAQRHLAAARIDDDADAAGRPPANTETPA